MKTEASKKPVPIDPYVAKDLLDWCRTSKYTSPEDYVFATDAARAGGKRGKQPLWLAMVMQYHIQPAAQRELGITKSIGWHTFRHTFGTLLNANGENPKVIQELLRHANLRVTMDTYFLDVRPRTPNSASALECWRPRRDLNPCYRRESVARCCNRLKPGGMDSALPPRKAPSGHLHGRVVDARTCFRGHCIPRAATSSGGLSDSQLEQLRLRVQRWPQLRFTYLDDRLAI